MSADKLDVEAIKWAIALLEIHPGVKVNPNSQMWLRRLRIVAGATEDELMVASVDGFLDTYCDGVVTEAGEQKLGGAGSRTVRPESQPLSGATPRTDKMFLSSAGGIDIGGREEYVYYFARQLERELAAAREDRDIAEKEAERLRRESFTISASRTWMDDPVAKVLFGPGPFSDAEIDAAKAALDDRLSARSAR